MTLTWLLIGLIGLVLGLLAVAQYLESHAYPYPSGPEDSRDRGNRASGHRRQRYRDWAQRAWPVLHLGGL